jgi:hypothetical protein
MPPKVVERDKSPHLQSPAQKVVWKYWLKGRREIFKMLDEGIVDELIVFFMGDVVHGDRKPEEVFASSLRTQCDTFIACVKPFTARASKVYFIRGTKYHIGEDGIIEDTLAQELGCFGLKSFMKMEVNVQGVRFMLQHKGPRPGSRRWTKGNSMRYFLNDRHIAATQRGTKASDIYLWAHNHEYRREAVEAEYPGNNFHESKGYLLPAWCVANEFALANVGHLELSDIGNIYFIVEDGVAKSYKQFTRFDNVVRVKHE